jgi:hypothetical protein
MPEVAQRAPPVTTDDKKPVFKKVSCVKKPVEKTSPLGDRENECRRSIQLKDPMPFYFRKSVSAGPFRFNFSKSGVGLSVGVRGLRVGIGPRGHYIHAGRNGFYYRASLGRAGDLRAPMSPKPPRAVSFPDADPVQMVEVESGDVLEMRDEAFSELLDEINSKSRQVRISTLLGWTFAAAAVAVLIFGGKPAIGAGFLIGFSALPAWVIGRWIDSYRRTSVLLYNFDEDVRLKYESVVREFDALTRCSGKWHVEAGGAIQDMYTWKRNAGASHLVRKKTTVLTYQLPSVIKSNVTPPVFHAGRQKLYFFPDVLFVESGSRMGAVSYGALDMRWQDSRFIEEGRVPSDAQIVGHTWKHPNKSGGPDRRFNNNYQIPVCLYEALHFRSNTGVNELLEFSKTGVAGGFVRAVESIPANKAASHLPAIGKS